MALASSWCHAAALARIPARNDPQVDSQSTTTEIYITENNFPNLG